MKTILVIENDYVKRRGWEKLLNEWLPEFEMVFIEEIEQLKSLKISTETVMAVLSIENADEISSKYSVLEAKIVKRSIPLLVYYTSELKMLAVQLVKAGLVGCVCQSEGMDSLASGVFSLFKRERYACKVTRQAILDTALRSPYNREKKNTILSRRERQIAEFLAQGMSTSQIGREINLKISTISTVKYKVFLKMKVSNIVQLSERMKELRNTAELKG